MKLFLKSWLTLLIFEQVLLITIILEIKSVRSEARQAPFCIDTGPNADPAVKRFMPIFDYHNTKNEFVPVINSIESPSGFVKDILVTRVSYNVVPITHPLKVLRHWMHIHVQSGDDSPLEGLYMQVVSGPMGIPKGQFRLDFDCKDCSLPTSKLDATAVGCRYRPVSSMQYPNVVVIGGKETSTGSFTEAHFHFNWIDHPLDEFPYFQFLIVAVKNFKCKLFETYYTNILENVYHDQPNGIPYPFYPGWRTQDITCHRPWDVSHQLRFLEHIKEETKIRYNKEYDECIVKGNKVPEKLCPPGVLVQNRVIFGQNAIVKDHLAYLQDEFLAPCRDCGTYSVQDDPCKSNPGSDCCPDEGKSTTTTTTTELTTTVTIPTTTMSTTTIFETTEMTTTNLKSSSESTTMEFLTSKSTTTSTEIINTPDSTNPTAFPVTSDSTTPDVTRMTSKRTTSTPELITSRPTSSIAIIVTKVPLVSSSTVELKTKEWITHILTRFHGLACIFCFAFPTSIGYFYARFMKESQAIRRGAAFFGIGDWLVTHVTFVYISIVGLITGMLMVFSMDPRALCRSFDGQDQTVCLDDADIHVVAGSFAIFFFCSSYLTGWWRPEDPKKRNIVIIIHVFAGYASKYTSFVSAFLTNVNVKVLYCWVAAEVLFIIIFILATGVQWIMDLEIGIIPRRKFFPTLEAVDTFPEPPYECLRATLLVAHCAFQTVTFAALYLVYTSPYWKI